MIDDTPPTEQTLTEVQQAEIMLAARRGIHVKDAGGVLRTIAHCAGTPVLAVARYVLAGGKPVS